MLTNLKQFLSVWIIKKIQKYGPHHVRVLGKTYEISEKVFNPKFYYTSEFMARHIKVRPDDVVLDMGTGSGIQALTAGRTALKVVAVDINPEAVQFARENVTANGLENIITVLQGDLFSPLNERHAFSVILFTPPYLDGKPKSNFDHALFDFNKNLIERFFIEAKEYLKPDGYVQVVYSSIAKPEHVLKIARQLGWDHRLIAQKKTFAESFLIYKFTLN
jgi:release factor glutamine methyltransferase